MPCWQLFPSMSEWWFNALLAAHYVSICMSEWWFNALLAAHYVSICMFPPG